jgi:hypothetical protein
MATTLFKFCTFCFTPGIIRNLIPMDLDLVQMPYKKPTIAKWVMGIGTKRKNNWVLTEKSSLRALLNSSRSARLESADVGDEAPLWRPASLNFNKKHKINCLSESTQKDNSKNLIITTLLTSHLCGTSWAFS